MINIFYLEDDPVLGDSLKLNLELEGYKVSWFKTISEASASRDFKEFDLFILDYSLPDGTGLEFCKMLRQVNHKQPVIMLTAQLDESIVIESLNSGANDYIKKPFSSKELFARIRVALRVPYKNEEVLKFDQMILNATKRTVHYKNSELTFNRKEFELLKIFFENAEAVISRDQLLEKASFSEDVNDRTIDSHLSHIRRKFKDEEINSIKIKSEYGVGYRLVKVD